MRTYDIPYVRRGPADYKPIIPLEQMTITQIKDTYIKTCAKASGRFSVCEKCENKCKEGQYAIDIMSGKVKPQEEIPLFDGKTMLEKAKEENEKRRALLVAETKEEKPKKQRCDGWWEESLKSDDQIKWVMEKFNLPRAKASYKISQHKQYRKRMGLPVETRKKKEPVKESSENTIEAKIAVLMARQGEIQGEIDHYYTLYQEAQMRLEEIDKKIDVLCSAVDIISGD